MSRTAPKKGSQTDRRKKPRKKPGKSAAPKKGAEELCYHCGKDLKNEDKALFVEEEVGRVFCSEDCITANFMPEIDRLEREYFARLSKDDLSATEREKHAHLRWITLQEPDEVWQEKTLAGDYRYTLISEFKPGQKPIWCICICLALRGEPSFLFLAFSTKNAAMVNQYRKGEEVDWKKLRETYSAMNASNAQTQKGDTKEEGEGAPEPGQNLAHSDVLADAWTEDETFRAQLVTQRRDDDIPAEEFGSFQNCLDEALDAPDEVWKLETPSKNGGGETVALYHFIKSYPEHKPQPIWYVIIARETDNEEEIEILDAFPTRDPHLVENFRRGSQEVGAGHASKASSSRMIH